MTEKPTKQAKMIARIFAANGWTWYDSPLPPKARRIQKEIDRLTNTLLASTELQFVESGRISVQWDQEAHHQELYVHILSEESAP